ncbi:MAG: hypothetical protein KDD64_12925, partial [Bdellovibrionales bacterium]|nr:hypothetical protein [Bdellovibrionales bacterium]
MTPEQEMLPSDAFQNLGPSPSFDSGKKKLRFFKDGVFDTSHVIPEQRNISSDTFESSSLSIVAGGE